MLFACYHFCLLQSVLAGIHQQHSHPLPAAILNIHTAAIHTAAIPTAILTDGCGGQERFTGGRMGYGAKLANIFSTEFEVVTCDPDKGLMYTQQWKHNMSICSEPEITEVPKGG